MLRRGNGHRTRVMVVDQIAETSAMSHLQLNTGSELLRLYKTQRPLYDGDISISVFRRCRTYNAAPFRRYYQRQHQSGWATRLRSPHVLRIQLVSMFGQTIFCWGRPWRAVVLWKSYSENSIFDERPMLRGQVWMEGSEEMKWSSDKRMDHEFVLVALD